jgi:carboxypeptidase C (cathepsin A)
MKPDTKTAEQNSDLLKLEKSKKEFNFRGRGMRTRRAVAMADQIQMLKNDELDAEVFYTAYWLGSGRTTSPDPKRPLTFVMNGGPGAASAYLHMGGVGPRRVKFGDEGELLAPPVSVVENEDSWLSFTDLVFIDPIGTGFSRVVKKKAQVDGKPSESSTKDPGPQEYFGIEKDLECLGDFIRKFLSEHGRWTSPVYIAGESYGGFRVAKLARSLQEKFGVGLSGAILISPALELHQLNSTDYESLLWADLFPSLVASGWIHKKGSLVRKSFTEVLRLGESFAREDYVKFLVSGGFLSEREKETLFRKMSDLTGLSYEFIERKQGRILHLDFARELLRSDRKFCGLYDASVTLTDPFPDRDQFQGPDPTLFAIDRIFASGVNSQLREWLGVKTSRTYQLLSLEVNSAWKNDRKAHAFDLTLGATDDLRYAMALNPFMKVFIVHGTFDLVTPYFSSERLVSLMRLTKEQKEKMTLEKYFGGHMFYTWKKSREAFANAMKNWMTV